MIFGTVIVNIMIIILLYIEGKVLQGHDLLMIYISDAAVEIFELSLIIETPSLMWARICFLCPFILLLFFSCDGS